MKHHFILRSRRRVYACIWRPALWPFAVTTLQMYACMCILNLAFICVCDSPTRMCLFLHVFDFLFGPSSIASSDFFYSSFTSDSLNLDTISWHSTFIVFESSASQAHMHGVRASVLTSAKSFRKMVMHRPSISSFVLVRYFKVVPNNVSRLMLANIGCNSACACFLLQQVCWDNFFEALIFFVASSFSAKRMYGQQQFSQETSIDDLLAICLWLPPSIFARILPEHNFRTWMAGCTRPRLQIREPFAWTHFRGRSSAWCPQDEGFCYENAEFVLWLTQNPHSFVFTIDATSTHISVDGAVP
jgi:hypothetical protein